MEFPLSHSLIGQLLKSSSGSPGSQRHIKLPSMGHLQHSDRNTSLAYAPVTSTQSHDGVRNIINGRRKKTQQFTE